MPRITLPDGSTRHFDGPVTGVDIAASIGKGLARAALAIKVDGTVRDLATTVDTDASVAIVTRDSEEALELLRHDAAHVLAEAVKELWPQTQITIGPAIENGFYYDFAREQPFTPEDLERMEERMREIVDRDEPISREVWDRDEAVRYFREWGEAYKAEIIESIPSGEPVSLYRQGEWIDLCRGPHLPSTGRLGKAFKLMRISGAYSVFQSRNEPERRVELIHFHGRLQCPRDRGNSSAQLVPLAPQSTASQARLTNQCPASSVGAGHGPDALLPHQRSFHNVVMSGDGRPCSRSGKA